MDTKVKKFNDSLIETHLNILFLFKRVPENVYMDNIDLLGNVFVDTVETIRTRVFLEFSNIAQQNVILFGPQGSGKTKLLQDFVEDFGSYRHIYFKIFT
jgi:type IV secretory pathway ATPase VirB11/archaellum biosynthesis ATPase